MALRRGLVVAMVIAMLAGMPAGPAEARQRIVEYPLPTPDSSPQGIVTGPDGALWFTENLCNNIGRITAGGAVTEYPIPTPDSHPVGITTGPDGNLWFTESSQIGRV